LISGSKTKITVREIISYVISLSLALLFLYFAFRGENIPDLLLTISSASFIWITVFILLTIVGHYLRAIRWKYLIGSVKKNCSVNHLFGSLMIGYGVNNVIPRLGEVSRAVAVGKLETISRSSVFGTIIVERVIDIIFFGVALILSAFLYEGDIYSEFSWLKPTIYLGTAIITVIIVVLIFAIKYKEKFYKDIIKIVNKFSESFAHKLATIFDKLINGFSSLKGIKNYFVVLLHSVLIIFSYWLNTYVGLTMLGMHNHAGMDFYQSLVIMSISSIGVMIPTPGGIGSYHTITKSVLISLYGYSGSIGIAYATLTHGISYAIHTLLAAGYFILYKNKIISIQKDLFKLDEKP